MKTNLNDAVAIFSDCFSIMSRRNLGQEVIPIRVQAFATFAARVRQCSMCVH